MLQDQLGIDWSKLENDWNYQEVDCWAWQLPRNKEGDPEFWVALAFESEDGEEWLILKGRPDGQNPFVLFVFGMDLVSKLPTWPDFHQSCVKMRILGRNSRLSFEESETSVLRVLRKLPITKILDQRTLQEELKQWRLFLQAQEAIVKERSIPMRANNLQVEAGKGRRRETLLTYDLDPETIFWGGWEKLEEWAKGHGGTCKWEQGKGRFEFWGGSVDRPINEVEDLLEQRCLRWAPKTERETFFLPFRLKTKQIPKSLYKEFGDRIQIEDSSSKWTHNLLVRSPEQLDKGMDRLEELEKKIEFPHPKGITHLQFETDHTAFEELLNEIWGKIGRSKISFLTEGEKDAYERESKGKGGHFRGGLELGELKGLRKGKITIRVDEERADELLAKPIREGYLLPTSRGTMSQIRRMGHALRRVEHGNSPPPVNPRLSKFIFDPSFARVPNLDELPTGREAEIKGRLIQKNLNASQLEAVKKGLEAEDLVLIQGPPGTGKTTVIAELILLMLKEHPDARILLSSQSHLAVDNALDRLYGRDEIRPIRMARNTSKSVEEEGRKFFEQRINDWSEAGPGSKKEKENANNIVREWMGRIRDRSAKEVRHQASLEKWRKLLEQPSTEIKRIFRQHYLASTNVVAATCLESGRREFDEDWPKFYAVIIDEASKSLPTEMLIPLVRGQKCIIIGDHRQLPPMVEEKDLKEKLEEMGEKELVKALERIKKPQFQKLFELGPAGLKVTLRTQYRMHSDIMDLINPFYEEEGGLECGIRATQNLPDFSEPGSRWHGLEAGTWLSPDTHAIWVNVKSPELRKGTSVSNPGEAEAIGRILQAMTRSASFRAYLDQFPKREDREIGLVSFYGNQVAELQKIAEEYHQMVPFRVRTVDKFQGMERNIMIVSTVRSDTAKRDGDHPRKPRPNQSIGFAKDVRRINVAFSRARRLLIIVGNLDHFSNNHASYQKIREILARKGCIIDLKQIQTH